MKILIISHKESWPDRASPSGFSTVGGFPFQMQAIASLFDETRLLITHPGIPAPGGLIPLQGKALNVQTVPTPRGGRWHKLNLLPWALRHLPKIWRAVAQADAIHAAVPGDVGSIGLMVALLQRKPLFVRHCGTWGEPVTISDRLLLWLLERIAGGRNVVLATGGAGHPPSSRNPNITWIFSTTLSQRELDGLPLVQPWLPGEPLRLVTVCRLAEGKNVQAILHALRAIRAKIPDARLDVLGDGEYRPALEKLAADLHLSGAVTFHGNVSHAAVMENLSRSHLFVFPTRVKEGFPKAVLEALACGVPVLAPRVSVIPQLLKNGSGRLLAATDAPAVAGAVLELLAAPNGLAGMGALARQAAHTYTLEAWGEAIGERLRAAWGPLVEGGSA